MYKELENTLLNWSLNTAADFEFEEELLDAQITAVYPKKMVEPENWTVFRVDVFQNLLNRTVVTLHIKCEESNGLYYQRIRMYSPHIPIIKDLKALVGSKVLGVKALCSVRNYEDDRPVLIVSELKLLKTDGKKCNISIRLEDEKSAIVDISDVMDYDIPFKKVSIDATEARQLMANQTLTEEEYIIKYFAERPSNKLLTGLALED